MLDYSEVVSRSHSTAMGEYAMTERERNLFGSPGLRLIQVYTLLSSTRQPHTLTRLAQIFNCSRQTILRLMDQVSLIPQTELETWVSRKERCYRIAPQATPNTLIFTPDAIRHLALCRDIVAHLLPQSFNDKVDQTLNAAATHLAGKANALAAHAEPWVKGHIDYTPFQHILDDMQTAMCEHRLCQVAYHSRSAGKQYNYLIAPLHIIAYREALYLRARLYAAPNRPSNEFRTLAIHRVKTFHLTPACFAEVPDEDHDPAFGFLFHDPIRVRVAFWGGAATYAAERTWSKDQRITRRRDGALILTFTATSRLEVLSWVLSFGPEAELLAPKDLREELKIQANAIAARYETRK